MTSYGSDARRRTVAEHQAAASQAAAAGQPSAAPRYRKPPPPTTQAASISVVRWGVLLGGLVIIVDLATQVASQRTLVPDDLDAIWAADEIINFVLFSILGILVVRDTGLIYLGAVAGIFASLLDATVVAAATRWRLRLVRPHRLRRCLCPTSPSGRFSLASAASCSPCSSAGLAHVARSERPRAAGARMVLLAAKVRRTRVGAPPSSRAGARACARAYAATG